MDVAVEEHHRNSAVVYFLYDWGESLGLVGRGHDYVETIVDEISKVGYLTLVAVVGRPDFHFYIVMEHGLAEYLLIHLPAPVVVAALRHANAHRTFMAAAGEQYCQRHYQNVNYRIKAFHGLVFVSDAKL